MSPLQSNEIEKIWRTYLTTGEFERERRQRGFFRMLPGTPRCKNCYAPFRGAGSHLVRLLYNKRPSNLNPQLCNICEIFAREYQGGAEIELSLMFADVRGSSQLAEQMTPTEFSQLINRFYSVASRVLVREDALVDKIIGDQAAGMFVPGIAGENHPRRAVQAARELLLQTGHYSENGPWLEIGVGVHTGTAFVGSVVSSEGTADITVLGDAANTAARLSSHANTGEILVSHAAAISAGMDTGDLVARSLQLKGKSEPVRVYVLSG